MATPIHIIGLGMSPADLTTAHLDIIRQADVLVGGKRHLAYFGNLDCEKMIISGAIRPVVDKIEHRMKSRNVVVLASGDPLYFGIGSYIAGTVGKENVSIHPNVSTVSAAFSRIGLSWNDAAVVSFHGRNKEVNLSGIMAAHDKVAVYTDPERGPAWLARRLLEMGAEDIVFRVCEQLGDPKEKVGEYPLAQAAQSTWADPNIVLLIRKSKTGRLKRTLYAGMPDDLFQHEKGLITKSEVRAVTLAKLALGPRMIFWDLGAGSGSISIEASVFIRGGSIFAVERSPSRIEHIRENQRRFGLTGLNIIEAELPDGLSDLPDPDRVFIGGGGRNLAAIAAEALQRLKPGGILAVNTVLIENLEAITAAMQNAAVPAEIVQVQVSRGKGMPWGNRLEALNPVWIVSGTKPGETQ